MTINNNLGTDRWLRWMAESHLQALPTIWLRCADSEYDRACSELARRFNLRSYEDRLFGGDGGRGKDDDGWGVVHPGVRG